MKQAYTAFTLSYNRSTGHHEVAVTHPEFFCVAQNTYVTDDVSRAIGMLVAGSKFGPKELPKRCALLNAMLHHVGSESQAMNEGTYITVAC